MSEAGRREALDRWSRNREVGDLETELAALELQEPTAQNVRKRRDLQDQIDRRLAAERERP